MNLIFPILFSLICGFLVIFPVYDSPLLVGVDLAILGVGVIVYLIFIKWQNKPEFVQKLLCK